MIAALIKRQLAKFQKRYSYDTTYIGEVADLDPHGAVKLALVTGFTGHRFDLPTDAYFAAKITAVQWADCGSCLRLAIAMAIEADVRREEIAALLVGSAADAPEAMVLARRYARAVIENDPCLLEVLEACERRWGRRGVAGLAAATVSGLFYPLFKRGLGYGNACEPVYGELRALMGDAAQRDAGSEWNERTA
ncbi:hypothetical protein [Sinorhizobium fredii]|uniref:hypothetical protein n=1 Tax=Rhizobium fredii TaxID=380 RepID=UPI0004AD3787|nr:hypothetical protein [Sinorhizobium fredii]AWI60604.1 hypothetical protein AB395_00005427 [Sinorhizobium fredii CCBAU 45436]